MWGADFIGGARVITSPRGTGTQDRQGLNQIPDVAGTIIQVEEHLIHVQHDFDGSIGLYSKNDLLPSPTFPIGMRCRTVESPIAPRDWDETQVAARKFGVSGAIREKGPFPNTWVVGGHGFRAIYEEREVEALLGDPHVYNKHYDLRRNGDCVCGHEYYRHFDSYTENMDPIGCKYCDCGTFREVQSHTKLREEHNPVEKTHPFTNMDTGEQLTGSQMAAQDLPVRPLTLDEEKQERGHAQAMLDEDDPNSNNPQIVWVRKLLRAYATLDEARRQVPAKTEWEAIDFSTARLKVPGGWLYRTRAFKALTHYENFPNEFAVTAESTVFIPDPLPVTIVP